MTIRRQLREGSLSNVSGEPEILTELWQEESAGIGNILSVYPRPYRPSGGEKQRILLAMAFKKIRLSATAPYGDSGLFVFDEASGSLDDSLRNRFLTFLFDRFRDHPFTTLFITHDYSMISAALALGPDIRDRFAFRELALNGERTVVKEFSPTTYTTWISGRAAKKKHAPAKNGAVLEVQSGARILGRWVLISRNGTEVPEQPLTVHKGRMTYLKAPSGAGKTSFAKALMGIIPSRNLRMRLGNLWLSEHTPESSWRHEVQGRLATMVFQHADEALNQQARVSEILDGLSLPERYRKTGIQEFLGFLFDEEEIPLLLTRQIRGLSGGQKQKLNLLRSLVLDTDCIILDEPLNGLDFRSILRVLKLLDAKRAEGKGLLVIAHNEEIFDAYADEVYHLRSRR